MGNNYIFRGLYMKQFKLKIFLRIIGLFVLNQSLLIFSSEIMSDVSSSSSSSIQQDKTLSLVLEGRLKYATAINRFIDSAIYQNNGNNIMLNNKDKILILIDLIVNNVEDKTTKKNILETRNLDGISLLDLAALYRDKEIAQKLLDNGVNVNAYKKSIAGKKNYADVFPAPMWILDYNYNIINPGMLSRDEMLEFFFEHGYNQLRDGNGTHIINWALDPKFKARVTEDELNKLLTIIITQMLESGNSQEDVKSIISANESDNKLVDFILTEIMAARMIYEMSNSSDRSSPSSLESSSSGEEMESD